MAGLDQHLVLTYPRFKMGLRWEAVGKPIEEVVAAVASHRTSRRIPPAHPQSPTHPLRTDVAGQLPKSKTGAGATESRRAVGPRLRGHMAGPVNTSRGGDTPSGNRPRSQSMTLTKLYGKHALAGVALGLLGFPPNNLVSPPSPLLRMDPRPASLLAGCL